MLPATARVTISPSRGGCQGYQDDARRAGAARQRRSPTISVGNRLNQNSSVTSGGGSATLAYDANGNLTSDGTFTFEYDEENRLRTAVGAGNTVSYGYDPLGRRREKVVNGTVTRYASDGAEEIEERTGANVVLRKYAYGPAVDDRIAMFDSAACAGGGRCFYLANWQGSTTTLIQQNNTLKDTYRYGPYGERVDWTPQDPDTGNPFRYTGRRYDPETGLYYYRARYYSPKLGRFLQTDPIGTEDDLNVYLYALNDPVNRIDPLGDLSYVVSRQLIDGKVPYFGHAFLATNARYVGDPEATIYSWGRLENGKVGWVRDETYAADQKAWAVMGRRGTRANISQIRAPDALVDSLAQQVDTEHLAYARIPGFRGLRLRELGGSMEGNSNAPPFAVGDRAEQIHSGNPNARVDRSPFDHIQPGRSKSKDVRWSIDGDIVTGTRCDGRFDEDCK